MDSNKLRESWQNTSSHNLLSKYMKTSIDGNSFILKNIQITMFKRGFGVHFQFPLENKIQFINITSDDFISCSDDNYFEENKLYDIEIQNSSFNNIPCLLISFKVPFLKQIYEYRCVSLTIGPVSAKDYEISL